MRRTSVVTDVVKLAGTQSGEIDVYDSGRETARLVVRWGKLHVTFTGAEQVQHLRGYFAMARQGMLRAQQLVSLSEGASDYVSGVAVVVTWLSIPDATASIEQMYLPRLRCKVTYVALRVGHITFRVADRAALDSVAALLKRAHGLAIVAFVDGDEHRSNPTLARRHPHDAVRFGRRGEGWIPRH